MFLKIWYISSNKTNRSTQNNSKKIIDAFKAKTTPLKACNVDKSTFFLAAKIAIKKKVSTLFYNNNHNNNRYTEIV